MPRVMISVDEERLKRIDDYASRAGLSRSMFLVCAAIEYIDAREKAPIVSSAFSTMASLIDDYAQGKLTQEQFQTRVDLLGQSFLDFSGKKR